MSVEIARVADNSSEFKPPQSRGENVIGEKSDTLRKIGDNTFFLIDGGTNPGAQAKVEKLEEALNANISDIDSATPGDYLTKAQTLLGKLDTIARDPANNLKGVAFSLVRKIPGATPGTDDKLLVINLGDNSLAVQNADGSYGEVFIPTTFREELRTAGRADNQITDLFNLFETSQRLPRVADLPPSLRAVGWTDGDIQRWRELYLKERTQAVTLTPASGPLAGTPVPLAESIGLGNTGGAAGTPADLHRLTQVQLLDLNKGQRVIMGSNGIRNLSRGVITRELSNPSLDTGQAAELVVQQAETASRAPGPRRIHDQISLGVIQFGETQGELNARKAREGTRSEFTKAGNYNTDRKGESLNPVFIDDAVDNSFLELNRTLEDLTSPLRSQFLVDPTNHLVNPELAENIFLLFDGDSTKIRTAESALHVYHALKVMQANKTSRFSRGSITRHDASGVARQVEFTKEQAAAVEAVTKSIENALRGKLRGQLGRVRGEKGHDLLTLENRSGLRPAEVRAQMLRNYFNNQLDNIVKGKEGGITEARVLTALTPEQIKTANKAYGHIANTVSQERFIKGIYDKYGTQQDIDNLATQKKGEFLDAIAANLSLDAAQIKLLKDKAGKDPLLQRFMHGGWEVTKKLAIGGAIAAAIYALLLGIVVVGAGSKH